MINHVSLNALLCDISKDNPNIRYVKVIRSYKGIDGLYSEDIIPCMMWTRNNKNSLFSFKNGTFVSIDGRIEKIDNELCVIIEQLTFISQNVDHTEIRGM